MLDFDTLEDWPDKILTMQRNWIGRSEGVEIGFDISENGLDEREIKTFTTRIDTIFGVTFLVLAPEHPLVPLLTSDSLREEVEAYIAQARGTSEIDRLSTDKDKTGVFIGSYARNRLNGEQVPIYIADYVLTTYGTGAVMGVPAHDSRDLAFARKYRLPIRTVIAPIEWDGSEPKDAYLGEGFMTNSGAYDGMTDQEGMKAVADDVERRGWGRRAVTYRLRDWLISRQRYWGYADSHGVLRRMRRVSGGRSRPPSPAAGRRRISSDRRVAPGPSMTVSSIPNARSAADRVGVKPTPWTLLWIHRGTCCAIAAPGTTVVHSPRKPLQTGCRCGNTPVEPNMP